MGLGEDSHHKRERDGWRRPEQPPQKEAFRTLPEQLPPPPPIPTAPVSVSRQIPRTKEKGNFYKLWGRGAGSCTSCDLVQLGVCSKEHRGARQAVQSQHRQRLRSLS